jgi:hypothetical protein
MLYIYRCPECGFEKEYEQSIHEAPPATIEDESHPHWHPPLKRVWDYYPYLNLGFREHHHTREEQFQFKNL